MKIALIFPRWTPEMGVLKSFSRAAGVWPPLNLAYLAALVEKDGHNVIIIDAEAENLSISKVLKRLRTFNPDLIGITATTTFFHTAIATAKEIKKTMFHIPVVIGGHHITALREKAFEYCFDYAFIGEAEISWQDFVRKMSKGEDVTSTKGILFRDSNGKIKFTGDSPRLEEVESLPFPSRHLLNPKLYNFGTMHGKKQFTSIYTVWGCPFRCIFCCTGAFIGKKIRKRIPESVIKEIKETITKDGTRHFLFLDDTLTLDRKHFSEICQLIIQEKLNITFEGSTRANLVDEDLIKLMVKAGLIRISFGLESVDEKIRKIMRKEVSLDSYIKANELTNKYGVETLNSCMIGLPGETHETLEKTLDFLDHHREIKQANISIAVPYPGTALYEMAKKGEHGLVLLSEDYSKYKRYNSAVMKVGNLCPKDLVEMQNYAFLSIYTAPWRLRPMINKSSKKSLFLMFFRFIKYVYALTIRSKNVTGRIFRRNRYDIVPFSNKS